MGERMRRLDKALMGTIFGLSILLATSPAWAGNTTYKYDPLGRLISATFSNGATVAYTYDSAGNRTAYTASAMPAPVAGNVSALVAPGSGPNPIALNITGAYSTLTVPSQPGHGSAVVTSNPLGITYQPNGGYAGADSFTYTASNAGGTSNLATVSVNVDAKPTVNSVGMTVAYGSSNNVAPLSFGGGAPASLAVPSGPSHGSVSINGVSISYSTSNYFGPDSFTYTATNPAGTSAPATVSITVNPQPPTVGPVSAAITTNSSNNVIALSFGGGTPTGVSIAKAPTDGTASPSGLAILYTPKPGYVGSDSLTYTASNAGGTSSSAATVSITVTPLTATIIGGGGATVSATTLNLTYPFPTNTVTVTGGSGSYSYLWTAAARDANGTWNTGGTGASFTPTVTVAGVNTTQATYTCTVTDTVRHVSVTSLAATYSYTQKDPGTGNK